LRKVEKTILKKQTEGQLALDPVEKNIMLVLMQFHEVVELSCREYKPNLVAGYLYELAQLFNSFYNKLPVLTAEEGKKELRLKIVQRSCTILQVGLGLLGINVPDRM
jgi:arginyl-tRNA synthetase